ncbi:MAG: dephospho-CoA kinase [Myxococcota bacterium]
MIVVGLTGGIACGKSAVAARLRERGVPVIDADLVAREVVEPGTPGLAQVVAAFGPTALGTDGRLDRAAMRARIAADPDDRRRLEAITHPEIRRVTAERLIACAAAGAPAAVVEAALLVETGGYRMYPVLIVVSCGPAVQLARVRARDGVDEAQARAIVATQLPLADKERVATHVIRNDGTLDALRTEVDRVWDAITPRSG